MRVRLHGWSLRAARHPAIKLLLLLALLLGVPGMGVFAYYYVRFSRLIDSRLKGEVFTISRVYAAPEPVFAGQEATTGELIAALRRAGCSENKTNRMGWYHVLPDGLEIFPGPESYFRDEPALLKIGRGKVQRIVSLKDNTDRQRYELEPQLVTNLFDRSREKRRLVRFEDLPPDFVNAVLAIEDRKFFQHSGVDFVRILKAAYTDVKAGGKAVQGASTLTQQLAGGFFLDRRQRTIKRKLSEAMISLQLERRLTKQQIFEFYVNQVNMGQRGSFSVNGVGEAALVYFGKDVKQLTLAESAFLAGIVRGPSYYSPYRHPDRARERRNRVLEAMVRIEAITEDQRRRAAEEPLKILPTYVDPGDAPYFVDILKDQLLERFSEKELVSGSFRIYTTLDMGLQQAASQAVQIGMRLVDQQLARRKRKGKPLPEAQAALVALDAHTGEVRALIGGRNYGASQLNRAVAKRQPGSSFKPFVYAAAFNSALDGSEPLITPSTVVVDEPTTFSYDRGMTYEPSNFQQKFVGPTTLRNALARSLNVATVKTAEMVGYEKVAKLAHEAGIPSVKPTPALALGAYEAMPLEMAGAYTIFANNGERLSPTLIRMVRAQDGTVLDEVHPTPQRVLDPRIAYLMTNLLEGVVAYGTGAGVRARGFTAPAAGKTGTSRDGWFAGYTSNLICIVWVGFDDNTELPLSGSQSALPIWTEFMKRAASFRRYRNMAPFPSPPGIVSVETDSDTGMAATPYCPNRRAEIFINGSQPPPCNAHSVHELAGQVRDLSGLEARPQLRHSGGNGSEARSSDASPAPGSEPATAAGAPASKKKGRGFFGRLFGRGDKAGDSAPRKAGEAEKEERPPSLPPKPSPQASAAAPPR